MRPAHRARQVARYHESEFKRNIKLLLQTRRILVADKTFDYDGDSVHTHFVLPHRDVVWHLGLILGAAIEQVGSLHPFYRALSMTCRPFGTSHTRIDINVRLQNHKAGVLAELAGFLVCLGWEMDPRVPDHRHRAHPTSPDRFRSSPHCIHLFDLKTHRRRLSTHACAFVASGTWSVGSASVETGRYHVHVNLSAGMVG